MADLVAAGCMFDRCRVSVGREGIGQRRHGILTAVYGCCALVFEFNQARTSEFSDCVRTVCLAQVAQGLGSQRVVGVAEMVARRIGDGKHLGWTSAAALPRTPAILPEKTQPAINTEKMIRNMNLMFLVEAMFF